MKIAVFANVHANLEALQAFLRVARPQAHRFIFLGDIVGYGPDPNACIAALRGLARLDAVLGNHDAAALWRTSHHSMADSARDAIFWTIEQLDTHSLLFLETLRHRLVEKDVCYCRANPCGSAAWSSLNCRDTACRSFDQTSYRISFVSHTHQPRLITYDEDGRVTIHAVRQGEIWRFKKGMRYIVNCGSVGQPRDGIADGSYCLYDEGKQTVTFHRFDYDKDKTRAKIHRAGLPGYLAARLRVGR